jgi:hypothetical protein
MRESRKLSLWEVTRPPVRIEDISWLSYGLLLDYNNAGRMLDEGPRADDTLEGFFLHYFIVKLYQNSKRVSYTEIVCLNTFYKKLVNI